MRRRPSARLLLLDEQGHVLLFRFAFKTGACAGKDYWATPGGAVEEGESFAEAARRELFEETGIEAETVGECVAEREFVLQLTTGEEVVAEERFFVVRTRRRALSNEHWSDLEKEVMKEHRWWSEQELQVTQDIFYPENLPAWLGDKTRFLDKPPAPAIQ
jgi:8-oxo-dGTP diphosphatase